MGIGVVQASAQKNRLLRERNSIVIRYIVSRHSVNRNRRGHPPRRKPYFFRL